MGEGENMRCEDNDGRRWSERRTEVVREEEEEEEEMWGKVVSE